MRYSKILFFLLSPAFLFIILSPANFFREIGGFPTYLKSNINSFVSPERLSYVEEVRWNAFGKSREDLPSQLYYNKGYYLIDNIFGYFSFISPRIYFQAGDGTGFSPKGVEPIAIPLFLFFILGILALVKKKDFKLLLFALIFGFVAFLVGRKNLAFLFPVLITYILIAFEGFKGFYPQKRKLWVVLLSLYALFLYGRIFLL
jgi:hypothetical protein